MSSEGATLLGSYSGASSTPTAAWFKWGTNSSSLNNTANATLSGESFSASISGLNPGSPYYYKAYVTVYGTGDYASQSQDFGGSVQNFTTKAVATATVTTNAASGVSSSQATLNASFSGATGTIYDRGFRYKKGNGEWVTPDGLGSTNGNAGSFSMEIGGLSPSTTYTFQAYVTEWDENADAYVDKWASNTLTFTTTAQASTTVTGWLELPEATSGTDYYTGNFTVSGKRNYSYLYQYSRYTNLWTAYPLYSGAMGSGYSASWQKNPQITESKQVNCWSASYNVIYGQTNYVNDASTASEYYARGHNIPNADRSGNSTMQAQTFYATNSTPQVQNKFNSTIWSKLEGDVRTIAQATDTVYVVTGAAFRKVGGNESITYIHPKGDSGKSVPVPNYYWKVLLKVTWSGSGSNKTVTSAKAIGVWIPHQQYNNSDYSQYVCSVKQIETWTGFHFFHHLPDEVEETAKQNTSWTSFQSYSNINSVSGNNWGSF